MLWAAGLENSIQPTANVSFVGPYRADDLRFGGFVKGMKPADMAGWDTPIPEEDSKRASASSREASPDDISIAQRRLR